MSTSCVATLFYIHGFNSSPDSYKAELSRRWLAEYRPDISFVCPFLSPFPDQAMTQLQQEVANIDGSMAFVGSSMGGFYATYLAEQYQCKAVLVNPAVRPWLGREYLLGEQANYHTGEVCFIEPKHLEQLQAFDVAEISRPEHFQVLLQTGDEVLDYRMAEDKYSACQLTVENGGDHSFIGFEQHLPSITAFLFDDETLS